MTNEQQNAVNAAWNLFLTAAKKANLPTGLPNENRLCFPDKTNARVWVDLYLRFDWIGRSTTRKPVFDVQSVNQGWSVGQGRTFKHPDKAVAYVLTLLQETANA
jgi:hypothetical protein